MQIKIKPRNEDNFIFPKRMTGGAAGYDIFLPENCCAIFHYSKIIQIPLGFSLEIPEGYFGQLCLRSGFNVKYAGDCVLFIPQGVGIIDSDYRGEIKLPLCKVDIDEYPSGNSIEFKRGDRICQLIFQKYEVVNFEISNELSKANRVGGFGSTGN